MTTAEVRVVFDRLKAEQVPLVAAAKRRRRAPRQRPSVPARGAAAVRAARARALRLRSRLLAARSDRAPVRELARHGRHPADHALPRDESRRPLRDDARVRPRALRERGLRRPRADTARARNLTRPARVAEPALGEPRRSQPPVLALLLPAAPRDLPGGAARRRARGVVQLRQLGRPLADPGRGRRGDVQPARDPPLRARAGAARGNRRPRRAAGDLERADARLSRRSSRRTTGSASSRTCTGRAGTSATSRPTRSET